MKEKNTLLHKFVCFQMHNKRLRAWSLLIFEWEITSFKKLRYFKRELFLTMFKYYQELSIARYQASNYFLVHCN